MANKNGTGPAGNKSGNRDGSGKGKGKKVIKGKSGEGKKLGGKKGNC